MDEFWGSHTNTLDAKGRINIPARYRKYLREEDKNTFLMLRGAETCINLYPISLWKQKMEEIKEKIGTGEDFKIVRRRLLFKSSQQTLDKQGRLNIPTELIEYAQLKGEVLLVGYEDRVEIWNPDNYADYIKKTEDRFQEVVKNIDF